jgi:phosphatidate cytidylyltransferase
VTRVLSGIVLLLLVGSAAWWGPSVLLLALALGVVTLAVFEYAHLAAALGAPVDRAATVVAAVAVCTAVAWPGVGAAEPVVMATVLAMAILAVGRGRTAPDSLARVAAGVFGPLYIGLPLGALIAVHWRFGREAALLLILVVIISDTAQYYSGRMLGRLPLAPALSPKKTVEGAIGGLVFGALALVVLGRWWWPEAPVALRAVLGATIVVLGITGDLFESLLKRAAGVKDSSGLIPGHGGVLDRIDALLFATPVYYIALGTLAGPA